MGFCLNVLILKGDSVETHRYTPQHVGNSCYRIYSSLGAILPATFKTSSVEFPPSHLPPSCYFPTQGWCVIMGQNDKSWTHESLNVSVSQLVSNVIKLHA